MLCVVMAVADGVCVPSFRRLSDEGGLEAK